MGSEVTPSGSGWVERSAMVRWIHSAGWKGVRVMESSPPGPTRPAPPPTQARPDPEFAPDPFPAPALPSWVAPTDHQRLVVNPFLAVASLVGWTWLTRHLALSGRPPLALVTLPLLGGLPFLVQFHCCDCGGTGSYLKYRTHVCPKILLRARRNRTRWLSWPGARTQLKVWCYLLGGGALLISIVGLGAFLAT